MGLWEGMWLWAGTVHRVSFSRTGVCLCYRWAQALVTLLGIPTKVLGGSHSVGPKERGGSC